MWTDGTITGFASLTTHPVVIPMDASFGPTLVQGDCEMCLREHFFFSDEHGLKRITLSDNRYNRQ